MDRTQCRRKAIDEFNRLTNFDSMKRLILIRRALQRMRPDRRTDPHRSPRVFNDFAYRLRFHRTRTSESVGNTGSPVLVRLFKRYASARAPAHFIQHFLTDHQLRRFLYIDPHHRHIR